MAQLTTQRALRWATAVWKGSEETFTSYKQFIPMFKRIFDHTTEGKEVSGRMLILRQGNRQAAAYALEFHTLAAESSWNMKAGFKGSISPRP